ncbi:hypothetical protein SAMN05660976_05713 [Nonomuraea pusilla]|uniref:Uncharacterized protein n=1 Tax=Nonomuraea pusilla TaxID=46177 RepID=A0A1H8A2X0_9ACTN|nr:hypothetical protein SAMN05660976_05713 [Nonomuraea pusilla]
MLAAQLLGQSGRVEVAPEPLVLVHHERDRDPGRAEFVGRGDASASLHLQLLRGAG